MTTEKKKITLGKCIFQPVIQTIFSFPPAVKVSTAPCQLLLLTSILLFMNHRAPSSVEQEYIVIKIVMHRARLYVFSEMRDFENSSRE